MEDKKITIGGINIEKTERGINIYMEDCFIEIVDRKIGFDNETHTRVSIIPARELKSNICIFPEMTETGRHWAKMEPEIWGKKQDYCMMVIKSDGKIINKRTKGALEKIRKKFSEA